MPLNEITPVFAEEYAYVPATPPFVVGDATVKSESLTYFETSAHAINVGVCLTVNMAVVVDEEYVVESSGVNIAVIVAVPLATIVAVEPEILTVRMSGDV